ncbi:hypothetical protein P5V15_014437 [Pogonomyrmex californicus]
MKSLTMFRSARISEFTTTFRTLYRNYYTTEKILERENTETREIHPYRRIHPWKSEREFVDDLLKNVIYNADGIIAINKPYGIPFINKTTKSNKVIHSNYKIVGAVDYTIKDVLPYLAKELNVPILIPCLGSEKYMSGVYIFGINDNVCNQIELAKRRTNGKYKKYWTVTIRVPNEIKGNYHLAMMLKSSVLGDKKPIILSQWSNNMAKKDQIQIMNISHKVLSNSMHNLSSLLEIESSSRKWNGIKLFASTMLYSPILGDNIHGSRVQEIMGTWMKVNPFAESCWELPKINRQLLDLLNITPNQQEIIPAHIHLRSVHLIFGKEKRDLVIQAPLIDPFDWTCKQLMFKIPVEARNIDQENEKN